MKYCVLYKGKICNDCGECLHCDLDPNKLCNNCGKCLIESDSNAEYRSINYRLPDDDYESEEFDAFLDEPVEIGIPDPIEIDSELIEEWEEKLKESFNRDRETAKTDLPKLHAVRARRKIK